MNVKLIVLVPYCSYIVSINDIFIDDSFIVIKDKIISENKIKINIYNSLLLKNYYKEIDKYDLNNIKNIKELLKIEYSVVESKYIYKKIISIYNINNKKYFKNMFYSNDDVIIDCLNYEYKNIQDLVSHIKNLYNNPKSDIPLIVYNIMNNKITTKIIKINKDNFIDLDLKLKYFHKSDNKISSNKPIKLNDNIKQQYYENYTIKTKQNIIENDTIPIIDYDKIINNFIN